MEGLVPWGSNYTFLVTLRHENGKADAIYKPGRGERPLWDFPPGSLCSRERCAYIVSQILGWPGVPPTILRDGPHGWGSVQYFVDHDPQEHYLTIQGQFDDQARLIALFDSIINNGDRKSGHVLIDEKGQLWAIDHGISFHSELKLRSVIWEFAGEKLSEEISSDLVAFHSWLCYGIGEAYEELNNLLSQQEISALERRVKGLIDDSVFPFPGPGRHYPWPLV